MIELRRGNILAAEAEALVNTVNCVGVMGRGVALQYRKAYPNNYRLYKLACDHNELKPGKLLVCPLGTLTLPRYIINFPTKLHWKGNSKLEYIDSGLVALIDEIKKLNVHSIALPPLGCGLGGLDWNQVKPRIEHAFEKLPNVRVLLFEPGYAPNETLKEIKRPDMTKGRAILLELAWRYLAALMDSDVTLLEIQKLMYFMQESGEVLRLNYVKAQYGPYAENLRHVLIAVDGYFISGYGDGEDSPRKPIEIFPDAVEIAENVLSTHSETELRLQRVSELIKGFETPYGMELLSTVHWVANRDQVVGLESIVKSVYEWNPRKKRFKHEHIKIAYETLLELSWLSNTHELEVEAN